MREMKFSVTRAKVIPFDFVLDALSSKSPITKPMFGSTGVYVNDKIVFILRDRESSQDDNGVWVCTTVEHHDSLRSVLPNMRSIKVFETPVTGWQVLAADSDDFEESVMTACELVLRGDPRIGKVTKGSSRTSGAKRSSAKTKRGTTKKRAVKKKSIYSERSAKKKSVKKVKRLPQRV